jgi:short-subunit dehydrogenase
MYSASKYAVEALTEALRIEVNHFGIKVSMVEPGDTKTGFTNKRIYVAASAEESAYNEKFMKSIKTMEVSEMNGPGPRKIVQAAVKIINMKNPPIRITAGFSYKVIVFLKRLLPARLVSYVVSKIY